MCVCVCVCVCLYMFLICRNSEKRKAKSRDAARVRRSNESDIFRELTELLPLSEKIRATLDKTSVTRLAICYIRLQELIKNGIWF